MPFKFTCPKCHRQNPLPENRSGTGVEVVCEQCGSRFRIKTPKAKTADPAAAPPAAVPDAPAAPTEGLKVVRASEIPEDGVNILWGIGDRIAETYEVTGLVGDDLYGQAYRVYHQKWMVDVNVKTPSPEILGRAASKESLIREGEEWAGLGLHPNIVTCYYVRVLGGAPRIFTEWVDGVPLTEWMRSGRLYEGDARQILERILDISIQAGRGLHHAHERGMTHGAIGPEDIIVDADRTTRVTHFGLIRTLEQARRSRRLSKRNLGQRSPEQQAGQGGNRRTDIWFLALDIADMLMGDTQWRLDEVEAPPYHDQLRPALTGRPRTAVPPALIDLLERCLADDPTERPLTLKQVRNDLEALYQKAMGHEYGRAEVDPDVQRADSLNNQGLARWDLGQLDQAEKLFDMAVAIDPECGSALYNHVLLLWRTGRISYEGLLNQLEAVPINWQRCLFLGQVAAEKKDPKASKWLTKAVAEVPRPSSAATQLERWQLVLETGQTVTAPMSLTHAIAAPRVEVETTATPVEDIGDRLDGIRQVAAQGHWKRAAEAIVEARLSGFGADQNPTLLAYQKIVARHQPRHGPADVVLKFRLEGHTAPVLAVAVTLDGDVAVSGSEDHTVKVWDMATGLEVRTLTGHTDRVTGVVIAPDGEMAASSSHDMTARTWDLATGKVLKTLEGHSDKLTALAMTPDGRVLVTSSQDKSLKVWNASTGRCLQTLEGHTDSVMSVAVSADGRNAASVSLDKTVRLWDLATGSCQQTFEGHQQSVWGLALTPDGRYLASSGDDKSVRIWDTTEGKSVQVLRGHTEPVCRVEMTPDARFVVSASYDRTIRLWDLQSGQCLESLGGHEDIVNGVAISLDSRRLLSASADRTLRVWDVGWSLEPHDEVEWDELVRPVLSTLLQVRLRRRAGRRAAVSGEEFERLLTDLGNWGYGWLSPLGIKSQVEKIVGATVLWWEPSPRLQAVLDEEMAVFGGRVASSVPKPAATAQAPPAAPPVEEKRVESAPVVEATPEPPREPEPPPVPVPEPSPAAVAEPELSPMPSEPVMQDLAPDLSAPMLLGPDGEPDLSSPGFGPPDAGLLGPAPTLSVSDLSLLPPPSVEMLAPPRVEDLMPSMPPAPIPSAAPAARKKEKKPEAAVVTEEKEAAPAPPEHTENGVAAPAEARVEPEPEPEPEAFPQPVPEKPPSAPEPETRGKEVIGPIRRAELEAAARRAKEVEPIPFQSAPAQAAPAVTEAPAEAPERPTDELGSSIEDLASAPQVQARKKIFTPAEALLKMAKPVEVAPALAGAEVALKRPQEEDVWEVGDLLLDLYQVTQFLGEGTMGKVYRVLHPGWNVELAMRTPRAAIYSNPASLERWLAEAQRWAELGVHPQIVSCYYARTAHDIPRIFMGHVESGTLGGWIHSGKLYDGGHEQAMARIVDVAIQVARGLAYAHSHDLIHQDVKPANVLMTSDGTAKLSDFGLARAWDGTLDEDGLPPGRELLTNIGGLTPAYASPEQVAKQELTHRTDVWSWGLLVLEMFNGEVTWTSGRQASKALFDYQLYGAENTDIPTMPEAISNLLDRCFKEKVDERPDSLADIAAELKKLYLKLQHVEYPREEIAAEVLLAATLSNRALAAADLGFKDMTATMFDRAVEANSRSLHAVFNRGLVGLRAGKVTFEALNESIRNASPSPGNDWEIPYLQAWLHIERGEEEEARKFLAQAHREAFNDPDGFDAITRAVNLARAYNANMSVLTAHGSPAWDVDLTDDAAFAISASDDSTLRVWDVSTGRCLRLLEGHTAAVFSVALSPEGHVALSGGEDMTLIVWNVGIGEGVHILEGHTDSVTGVILSRIGKLGASCSLDGSIRLWDIENGYSTKTLKEENSKPLTALAANGEMKILIAAEEGGDIAVWDVPAAKRLHTLKGHTDKVGALALTQEGTLAVSASDDGTLRVWDLRTGQTRYILEGHHGWVNGVALSPDGGLCISAGWDKTLRVWDVSTGRCLYTLTGHENHVRAVALNSEGSQAVSVTIDGAMGFWKLPEELAEAPWVLVRARASGHRRVDHAQFVDAVETADTLRTEENWEEATSSLNEARNLPGYEWSPVGVNLSDALSLHAGRGRLRGVWTYSILEARHRTMRGLTVSDNGRLAVTANGNRSVHVWDRVSARLIRDLKGHDGAVQAVALSQDGITAFSAATDQTVGVWNLPSSRLELLLKGHTAAVWCVTCSADGSQVISGGWDETVRLWSMPGGKCLKVFKGHDGPVLAVALSPDGRYVASGSSDNTVRVWDVGTGRCVRTLEGHDDLIGTVCFVGGSGQVLSGSNDHTLRLWDLETSKSLLTMQGHRGPVSSAGVSLDGRVVMSGSWDWTVRVWELPSGRCLRILDGHLGAVRGVALDRDGRHGVSVSEDGTLRQWLFDWAIEARAEADWDEGARIFLASFAASLRRSTVGGGRKVRWSGDELDELMQTLAQNGYGWLKRNGVEAELFKMTSDEK